MISDGIIFNIQRFSVHDGPGIRTTVFLKGCSLHCFWCHNPEGLKLKPEVQFDSRKCLFCSECVKICKNSAHVIYDDQHIYSRDRCGVCGECINLCFSGSLELIGKKVNVDEVMNEIIEDKPYYKSSGGGVTLSGGEPLLQTEFILEILKRSTNEGINTAVETSGNYQWLILSKLLPYINIIMMDIKHINSEKHKESTGVGNDKILKNAHNLALTEKPLIFRTPVIPTVNDSSEEITEICRFIKNLVKVRSEKYPNPIPIKYELLPFHKLASDKYRSLGLSHKASDLIPIPTDKMNELYQIVKFFEL